MKFEEIPRITVEQMIAVDRIMVEDYGIQLIQMMENAGRNLADLAFQLLGKEGRGGKVLVLCGTGNNGGGGMVAARHLHNRGCDVQVVLTKSVGQLKETAASQWEIIKKLKLAAEFVPTDFPKVDLVLDALIGYGLSGDVRPPISDWIHAARLSEAPILSLDVPSGVNGSTGKPSNPTIKAKATMTLALPKIGLFSDEASEFVGELYLADIGVPPDLYRRLGLEVPYLFQDASLLRID